MAAEISRGTREPRQLRYPVTKANIGRGTQGTAAKISRGTRVPLRPWYPGTKANIGRGTQSTAADFSRGTLWLDQSEAQEFWGLLIG